MEGVSGEVDFLTLCICMSYLYDDGDGDGDRDARKAETHIFV